jgi:hypothetical protein
MMLDVRTIYIAVAVICFIVAAALRTLHRLDDPGGTVRSSAFLSSQRPM